jgi:glucokinase
LAKVGTSDTESMTGHIICVDLGGSRVRTALFDIQESTIQRKLVSPTPKREPGQSVVRSINQAIHELVQDVSGQIQAIVVGSPGPLDIAKGVVIRAPLFQEAQDIPISNEIAKSFGVKTWVQNDANLAALGEYTYGAGRGSTVMVYMGIGTGIGGGIVIDGQLLTGSKGYAGEIGHICVEPDGLYCGCGRRGCLEAYGSGRAIEAEAYRVVHQGVVTGLQQVLNTEGRIRVEDVVLQASEGDKVAQSILQRAAKTLGIGLASLVTIFNPDCVVIGGGVSNAGSEFLDTIRRHMTAQAMFPMCDQVELVRCQLGDEAGLYGGLAYGRQMLGI